MARYASSKEIDRKIGGLWKIFGERPDGTMDVTDNSQDLFTGLPKDVAERVVAAHDRFRETLYMILDVG